MLARFFQSSRTDKPPLKVGLLLDTPVIERCFAEIIGHIRASTFIRLELVVLNSVAKTGDVRRAPAKATARKSLAILRNRDRRRTLLFNLYERWDQVERRRREDDPLAPVDCAVHLRGLPSIAIKSVSGAARPPSPGRRGCGNSRTRSGRADSFRVHELA